jgi:Bacterial self-protective colicin-like immunity
MEKYIKLLQQFAGRKINADEFEQRFLQLFKSDNNLQPGREFKILDKLFADVDAYCSDPDLIEDPRFDIGEVELQVSAQETLDKLLKLTAVDS